MNGHIKRSLKSVQSILAFTVLGNALWQCFSQPVPEFFLRENDRKSTPTGIHAVDPMSQKETYFKVS
jgi:hypothetical protein